MFSVLRALAQLSLRCCSPQHRQASMQLADKLCMHLAAPANGEHLGVLMHNLPPTFTKVGRWIGGLD